MPENKETVSRNINRESLSSDLVQQESGLCERSDILERTLDEKVNFVCDIHGQYLNKEELANIDGLPEANEALNCTIEDAEKLEDKQLLPLGKFLKDWFVTLDDAVSSANGGGDNKDVFHVAGAQALAEDHFTIADIGDNVVANNMGAEDAAEYQTVAS